MKRSPEPASPLGGGLALARRSSLLARRSLQRRRHRRQRQRIVGVRVMAAVNVEQVQKSRSMIREIIRETHANPIFVRLAWHDSGSYDDTVKQGGATASIRFKPELGYGANNGLKDAIDLLVGTDVDDPCGTHTSGSTPRFHAPVRRPGSTLTRATRYALARFLVSSFARSRSRLPVRRCLWRWVLISADRALPLPTRGCLKWCTTAIPTATV